eukprot:CAMPEP_0180163934 /NCGR_PEP_ID=MMETSP0986-20121125/30085_1 /TAXON_ID=697907 /ORGANISM="non described non described, Strain CCMP2293" /LENGTH=36 /DNA_ID= /DNA_START= /DNA_END= /DNA_ORIENTATION=
MHAHAHVSPENGRQAIASRVAADPIGAMAKSPPPSA